MTTSIYGLKTMKKEHCTNKTQKTKEEFKFSTEEKYRYKQ